VTHLVAITSTGIRSKTLRTARTWGWILLIAAAVFVARYGLRASDELTSHGPPESWGFLELAPPGDKPPDDVESGRPVELVGGGEALLLQRGGVSARLWSQERGEWVWFTDDLSRRLRLKRKSHR
jgi:hypothetical protein